MFDSLNIVAKEMLKIKQLFEQIILTLEEQMERVIVKLDKVVEGTKSTMRYEAKGTLNKKAKK